METFLNLVGNISIAATTICTIWAVNLAARTIVFSLLNHFGALDPRWQKYWPRLPWRTLWLVKLKFDEWIEENFKHGGKTAGKAGLLTQLSLSPNDGDSIMGKVRLGYLNFVSYPALTGEPSERHKLFIASARSGKSLQLQTEIALMPLKAAGLFIDPKETHTPEVLKPLERQGHKLAVFKPLGESRDKICLLAQMDFINERVGQDMTTIIADRLSQIQFPKTSGDKSFFVESAQAGWAAMMVFVKVAFPKASMPMVRRLLSVGFIEHTDNNDPEEGMVMLFKAMQQCDAYDGYVSSWGSQMLAMDDRTRENVLATMRAKTKYLDHEQIKAATTGNTVNLCDLKDPNANTLISLVGTVGDIRTTLRPLFGQIISLSLAIMEWIEGDLNPKTRFYLEEIQALGGDALQGVGEAFPLLPGYGASVIAVAQDIPGLRKAFPKDYKSMIGSAQHVIFMAQNDPETFEFIAHKAFGETTVKRKKWFMPFLWTLWSNTKPVITPDQVRRVLEAGRGNAVIMRNGKRSMIVKIAKSYKTLPVWMLNPSKDHGESPARAWFRSVWLNYINQRISNIDMSGDQRAVYNLTINEAESLFGLSGSYSRKEIENRRLHLNKAFSKEVVEEAYQLLMGVES